MTSRGGFSGFLLSARFCSLWLLRFIFGAYLFIGATCAQEVSFTPRYDGVESGIESQLKRTKKTPTPVTEVARAPQLYSLARFNLLFRDMCELLEADGRRSRIYSAARQGSDDEQICPSCRALARQIAQSCAPKIRLKKEPARPQETPTVATGGVGVVGAATSGISGAEGPPQVRYPRTELVEVLSKLSAALYDFSPGKGPVFDAIRSFELRIFSLPELTLGERDYYGIYFTYLLSAWAGRPESPLDSATPSPEEVSKLFGGGD